MKPDGTVLTDVDSIESFTGTITGLHDIGGPEETTFDLNSGWIEPDGDTYHRIYGEGLRELCRTDNMVRGTWCISTHFDIPFETPGAATKLFDLVAGFNPLLTMWFQRIDVGVLIANLQTGAFIPEAARSYVGESYRSGPQFHVGIVHHVDLNVGSWLDVYVEGNLASSDYFAPVYDIDSDAGLMLWAVNTKPLGDGSSQTPASLQTVNNDALYTKTHSLLIKRFNNAEQSTTQTHKIMRDHYRDRDTLPASAL